MATLGILKVTTSPSSETVINSLPPSNLTDSTLSGLAGPCSKITGLDKVSTWTLVSSVFSAPLSPAIVYTKPSASVNPIPIPMSGLS